MKQGTFILIICGLVLALLPPVSAESDADFLGRVLADAEIGDVHPTDWVQQFVVLEVVPEEENDEEDEGEYEWGYEDDCGDGDSGCGDDYGEFEDDFGECEDDFGEDYCGPADGQAGCDDSYYYVDFCNDAKLMGTGSTILAAAVILHFVL